MLKEGNKALPYIRKCFPFALVYNSVNPEKVYVFPIQTDCRQKYTTLNDYVHANTMEEKQSSKPTNIAICPPTLTSTLLTLRTSNSNNCKNGEEVWDFHVED